MKFSRWVLALALSCAAGPSFAASACYTPAQMQAEQLLRLHSELMVITVTCRQGSEGQDLPAAYGRFTQKNLSALHDAEQTLIAHYKASGKGDGIAKLDRLRTLLGNEYGQKVADMSAPNYCGVYRDKVVQMLDASASDIDRQVHTMEVSERSYAPLCGSSKTAMTKQGG